MMPELKKEQCLEILRLMYRIRSFEEHAKKLYRQNLLAGNSLGALHSYVGEEAIAVGVCACLRKDDYVFSTHRGHGHFIAKGGEVRRLLAEIMGKETGCSRGRGGSMHLFDPDIGFMGGNGIVGGGIPLALGTAYSSQYRGTDQVTICFFGDGAASQGTFHESLNIAALWKLPVVFVCENNGYAVTTPAGETIAVPDVSMRAEGYGMPGETIDGNDVQVVYQRAKAAVEKAREGKGPTLLECKTYRMDPHCMVITELRNRKELEEGKEQDPLTRFENRLKKEGLCRPEEFDLLKAGILRELEEAEAFAQNSPFPDPDVFRKET